MITVAMAVERVVKKQPYIEEVLSKGIINLSALARLILPEVREITFKKVQKGAVLMALKRMPKTVKTSSRVGKILEKKRDLIVRSNLVEFVLLNSNFSTEKHRKIINEADKEGKYFLTVTQGVFETSIIASFDLEEKIKRILGEENLLMMIGDLSSITIYLPKKNVLTPGVYYLILKTLAWEGVNIVEVVSTSSEFTIILEDKEVDRAFSLLKNISV